MLEIGKRVGEIAFIASFSEGELGFSK